MAESLKVASVVTVPSTSTLNKPKKQDQDPINVLVLGHSFAEKLKNRAFEMMAISPYLSMAKIFKCEDSADPWIHGRSGRCIADLPQLVKETSFWNPVVVILELGSNDLCDKDKNPNELAQEMYSACLPLFETLKNLELIVLCGITPKTYMWKGTKDLGDFNLDSRQYNDALTDIAANDNRFMKWVHRGTSDMTQLTLDGTHLNSKEGFKKHINSITRAIKAASKEVVLRKHEASDESVRRVLNSKRQKAKDRKLRKKAQKAI
jgi:hypothetical protein